MQSSVSELSFYFDMLFINSIESVKKSFIGNKTIQNEGYNYIEEYDYYIKDEMVEDNGSMPIFFIDIIKRDDFLERLLKFEAVKFLKEINEKITGLESKEIFINEIYENIILLLRRITKSDDECSLQVEISLLDVLESLKDRYTKIVNYHPVFKYLAKESDATFFKNKDLKYSFYVDLYETAYMLDVIQDDEIEEGDFINAFTSPNPIILENKVRFSQNNLISAYFLEKLKPFFHGFTHSAIEESGVFLNKQNKPLKSSDIYTALSRGKLKNEEYKNKIDVKIQELKSKHLN